MTCQGCGAENPVYANCCMDCGKPLTATPAPIKIVPAEPASPALRRRMVVIGFLCGLIALPIVFIVSALLIPAVLRARISSNEAAAVTALRQMNRAAVEYAATYGNGFPPDLRTLDKRESSAGCDSAGLLNDRALTAGRKSGYDFVYSLGPNPNGPESSPRARANGCTKAGSSAYEIHANPVGPGTTGQRGFFTDQTGIIRWEDMRPATADSQPLR
jgi:type IV pilus assembly protein PilA